MNIKTLYKSSLAALIFTVFIDLLGVGIVIPIFAGLFFIPGSEFYMQTVTIFGFTIDTNLLYGLMIASYSIAQFFGAPLIGDLSDSYGRKKLLIISLIGTLIGYIIMGFGIVQSSLVLLLLGRIIDGFTGGNISVAQSAISDMSTKETRTKNFGLIGMAFGFGFIIGPYIGGKLADPSIVSWFTNVTPFIFAIILTFINILLIVLNFKETYKVKEKVSFNLLGGITDILKAFKIPDLRVVFLVSFLFTFGFTFFTQFFQVFLIDKFNFNQSQVGDIYAYIGLWIAIAQGALLRPLSKKYKPIQFLSVTLLLLGISFFAILVPENKIFIYMILPFIAIFNGLSQPNLLTIISNKADESAQGEILGINQSVRSLATALPPIIAGIITSISINLPIFVAGAVTILTWIIVIIAGKKLTTKEKVHH